ncbi:ATP-binding protein [Planktothrix mougeotii]|uniref:histidine kinase n=1 Tax=Planktothrix mougeotii LEGE 06226 TaxID=1828728 RepID=A0ABR9UBS6_9CYAN|nr:ATP-binding protein [Planktothrix mougeotii]MBE9143569.1 GAF domain-containing protein [Planktothrix mougeotii LEGE 06226]
MNSHNFNLPSTTPFELFPEPLSLNNCDRELIHLPGTIQSHGILFVLSNPDLNILQVSNNTEVYLGIPPEQCLGQPLSFLFASEQLCALQECLEETFDQVNPVQLQVHINQDIKRFQGMIHCSPQNYLILELEPTSEKEPPNFFNFYELTKKVFLKLQKTTTLAEICEVLIQHIRKIAGFDRVMIYRFSPDGSGTVIAEEKREDLEPYLGLHYPDSDIPKQAKQLYIVNGLRLIPDINYQPVPIISMPSDTATEPLDLSFSVLRSVSPIHREYLKNMGVAASLSISLVNNNQLWGLIACHHYSPKFISYSIRTVCEFLGQAMSLELPTKVENENLDYKLSLKSLQAKFTDIMVQAETVMDALLQNQEDLLKLMAAEGAVFVQDEHLIPLGKTPSIAQLEPLILWLSDQFNNHTFVTDSLSMVYPPAANFQAVASGLLAISITKIKRNFILWFRPEQLQYVNWAGNPDKPKRIEEDGSLTIFPRKSFALWQETVQGKSLPWQPFEIEAALEVRSALVSIILQKAEELAAINLELQRTNSELDAFVYIASHDLKEPLRGIHNYSTFLLEDYGQVLDEDGVSKLQTLVDLTKRMEDLINSLLHFSRLGRQELNLNPLDLNKLIPSIVDLFKMSYAADTINIVIPRPLPLIRGDKILIQEVLTNLISNGLKYNNQLIKSVEIGYLDPEPMIHEETQPLLTLYIRDNGIGIPPKHHDTIFRIFKRLHARTQYGGGTGAGLTIVKTIIERHGGTIWLNSIPQEGTTFYFTLPYFLE